MAGNRSSIHVAQQRSLPISNAQSVCWRRHFWSRLLCASAPYLVFSVDRTILTLSAAHGRVHMWGFNDDGKMGHPGDRDNATDHSAGSLLNVPAPGGGQVLFGDAAVAERHTLLCSLDGSVYAAGYGGQGIRFSGDETSSTQFVKWNFQDSEFYKCLRVFAVKKNSYVLTILGQILAVGDGSSRQLGCGDAADAIAGPCIWGLQGLLRASDFAVGQDGNDVYAVLIAVDTQTSSAGEIDLRCLGSDQAYAMTASLVGRTYGWDTCRYLQDDLNGRRPISVSASGHHTNVQVSSGYLTWVRFSRVIFSVLFVLTFCFSLSTWRDRRPQSFTTTQILPQRTFAVQSWGTMNSPCWRQLPSKTRRPMRFWETARYTDLVGAIPLLFAWAVQLLALFKLQSVPITEYSSLVRTILSVFAQLTIASPSYWRCLRPWI